MVNQIGTNALYQQMTSHMSLTSNKINEAQTQASTGKRAQNYSGYGQDIKPLAFLHNQKESMTQQIQDNHRVIKHQDLMEASIRGLQKITNLFRNNLSLLRSGENPSPNMISDFAKDNLPFVQTLLNKTDENGQYLFSGTLNVPPVDINQISTYYQGDYNTLTAQIAPNLTFAYGIGADDPGISNLINALATAAQTNITSSQDAINNVMDLAEEAVAGLADILQRIGNNQKYVIDVNSRLKDDKVLVEQSLTEIEDVDLPEALTNLARYQTQLTALYMAMTSQQKLSLVDFMR